MLNLPGADGPNAAGFAYPELARRISAACGSRHQSLNHLITSALPLALPPKSRDARLFAAGLASFGMIYLTFEEMWQEVTASKESMGDHDRQILNFLASLRPQGIERGNRLRDDLRYLHRTGEEDILAPLPSEGPAEGAFRRHIQKSVASKPHNLYAYAWCMYMAIFAGGRYVREDLANAGEHFWRHHGWSRNPSTDEQQPADLDRLGYSFLSFDAVDDGLAIERKFCQNLEAADELFSEKEKEDVVHESQAIFDSTIDLVKEMSKRIKPGMEDTEDTEMASAPPPYSPPPYSTETSLDQANQEFYSLLQLRADEEEIMAWREPPLKRSLWFRVKLVVVCIVSGLAASALLSSVRFLGPQYTTNESWDANRGWS